MQTKIPSGGQNNLAHFLGAAVKGVEKEFNYLFTFGKSMPRQSFPKSSVSMPIPVVQPQAPSPVIIPTAPLVATEESPLAEAPPAVLERITPEPVAPKKPANRMVAMKDMAYANKTEEVEVEIYFRDLQSPSRAIRMQALRQIKKLSGATATAMLEDLLSREQDTLQIIELLNALAFISEEATTSKDVFKKFIHHQDTGIRLAALRAISKYHDDEGFNILVSFIKDKDPEVRRQILNCLCWSFGDKCVIYAVNALHDPDSGVRKAASQISGALKVPQAISGLITLLADPESDVQLTAAASLKKITGEDFGFKAKSTKRDKEDAIESWRFWWRENQTKFKRNLTRG
ncbi:MAG: HEAT repeat domain-containing protein [Candidatus Omnitrophica bacterium]|nr:HEAT repeat domain-containing protein [Candidatus Omnitrophota bacterium]